MATDSCLTCTYDTTATDVLGLLEAVFGDLHLIVVSLFSHHRYVLSMLPISAFLLIVAFTCFAASSPRDSTLFRATWLQIERNLAHHQNLEVIRQSIQDDNIMLGAGSLCVSSLNFFPSLLGILLSMKLKHQPQAVNADANHLRVVTRVANAVTLSFGVVCIAYGGYATVSSGRSSIY